MTKHLPECPILQPCCDDEENPDHGFCGSFVGRCLHCMAECICDALRACEERVTAGSVQRVGALVTIADSGWTYMNLLWRAQVIAAIKGDQP